MSNMKTIAFVTPWFGMNIPGGAEEEARELAKHLLAAGMDVEILTTCIKEFNSDWNINYHKEGEYREGDLLVRRFKADHRDTQAFNDVNVKLMRNLPISIDEEEIFLKNMANSSRLYAYMEKNKDSYSAFIFVPYMFGTTYYGCQICPEKSILIPCFHDESYFYMEHFKETFSKVAGLVYNAAPERDLTVANYPLHKDIKQIVMGIGMNTDQTGDAARFRKKFNIENPFIMYAGRKDKGKNIDTLLQYFSEFKKRMPEYSDLGLVLIGGGSVEIPDSIRNDVRDLGFVDRQDKYDAYAAAEVLCQPSQHESFSFVIMESWLAERPVMVADQCAVTRNFCKESNGGLWFKDYFEFEGALKYLLDNTDAAEVMGINGRDFVKKSFSWDVIIEKYKKFFGDIDQCL